MTPPRSLRSRLLSGAALWTAGLFMVVVLTSAAAMVRFPRYPYYLHAHARYHTGYMIALAVLCMAGGFWLVRRGLASVDTLRARLARVHAGDTRRVDGVYPSEVQPLVDDLNALLEQRDQAVRRAVAKAGDLAHGLKTPLAVLAHEAERARAGGQADIAAAIEQQVERMRRQIDYHLAHARAAASGGAAAAPSDVKTSAEALVRTMHRLHASRGLSIEERIEPGVAVRCQREDLDEMLGNLLDNACKWARGRVVVAAARSGAAVVVTVDDDGPGLPAEMRGRVLHRGVRADEAAPGSGLGLAIVRDLVEVYGGTIALADSPLGGLRAELRLPS